jgi:hypothetical protein
LNEDRIEGIHDKSELSAAELMELLNQVLPIPMHSSKKYFLMKNRMIENKEPYTKKIYICAPY